MTAPTVWLTTLGCSKNQVDSDKISSVLGQSGYLEADDPGEADVVMVNTCGFIEEARRESVQTILDLAEAKRDGAKLVVMGCMAQRYESELIDALPEADAVIGLDRYSELVDELDTMTEWQPIEISGVRRSKMDILDVVSRPTPSTPYAYVKVAEGCNKTCAFCVADVEGLARLRLYYLYPKEIRPALIDLMADHPTIADYFDLSLQHASAKLLRSMRRPGSGAGHLELIDRIRAKAPHAGTRSSFVVGYPGETEDDFAELCEFLEAAQLDWAGFFPYSKEEGTTAAELPNQIPAEEISERLRHIQRIQDDITGSKNGAMVGSTVSVLVDQVEEGQAVGRSYREAPEIDGVILLNRGTPGEWLDAHINGTYGTDLTAKAVGA
jgi:ribosomal protein S12 methylthiotransferase